MAIQMRRGQLANYDKSKMLPGEWGISIDNDSDNQKAFISFAPGVSKEVMMVEDAEEQIAVATAEAIDMATEEAEAWAHGDGFSINDYESGDGSTRAFQLSQTPKTVLGVYVDGASTSAYTISGKTITFSSAPASGQDNIRINYSVDTSQDNAKYYKEQAEAVAESIPEDYSDLSDDVEQLKNALTTKAEQDGAYPDLTAGQILSKNEASDSVPYNFRAVGHEATLEYTDAIVGGSVVKNQLVNSGMTSVTVPNGHKYLSIINSVESIGTSTGTGISVNDATKDNIFDLTQMFGTIIADYINTLETATAGAGVSWLKKHFPKMFTYQPYNAGEIVSVQGLSQHVTVGFNQWDEEWENGDYRRDTGQKSIPNQKVRNKNLIPVLPNTQYYAVVPTPPTKLNAYWYDAERAFISSNTSSGIGGTFTTPDNCYFMAFSTFGTAYNTYNHDICINLSDPARNGEYEPYVKRTYPLDDSLTLRGILKLDASNNLYADGDRYLPDGTVQRRYGVVDLGTLDWQKENTVTGKWRFYAGFTAHKRTTGAEIPNMKCSAYPTVTGNQTWQGLNGISNNGQSPSITLCDLNYSDVSTFKTAMSGVYLVYELATPTTEEADPYTVPQIVDPDGTEEYVSTSIVPVGHESRYPDDLRAKLDGLPWNLSMIAPIENGDKASQEYAVGKYFLHNNQFCKAKTAIAANATFTLNTNYEVTTVADEIYSALH